MKHISIAEMLNNPESYNESNFYGFYDWFCSDKSLKSKFKAMLPKIKFLIKHNIINPETTYVWFKNNCPCDGSLYTDIRFSLLDADNTFIGGICPSSGHTSEFGLCSVWYFEDKQLREIEFESWLEFKDEMKFNKTLAQKLHDKWYK
jgi:hypothetical protein